MPTIIQERSKMKRFAGFTSIVSAVAIAATANIDDEFMSAPCDKSATFSSAAQCQFTLDALFGVAGKSYVRIDNAADSEARE